MRRLVLGTPRSPRRMLVIVAVGALVAVACGGDTTPQTDGSTTNSAAPTGNSDTTQTADPGADSDLDPGAVTETDDAATAGEVRSLVRRIAVGETVYYSGFVVTVDEVLVGFDPAGFAVAQVRTTQVNNSPRGEPLQTAVDLESQGFVGTIDRVLTPDEIPAGSSGVVDYSIRLDATSFTFDDAVLFIGRPDRQRAQIPLGRQGDLITREPLMLTDLGSGSDGISSIDLASVRVGWDIADPRAHAAPGESFVEVGYLLDSTVRTSVGEGTIVLDLPDGTSVEPVASTATIAAVDAGVSTELAAAFLIPEPIAGVYTLRFVEAFDKSEVEVEFTLAGL